MPQIGTLGVSAGELNAQREVFANVGITEVFNADPRPTIVIELRDQHGVGASWPAPVFCNQAARKNRILNTMLVNRGQKQGEYQRLCDWAACSTASPPSMVHPLILGDHQWQCYLASRKWAVISCLNAAVDDGDIPEHYLDLELNRQIGALSVEQARSFDWTTKESISLSPHLQLLCAHDWSSTAVGRREDWTIELRVTLNLMNSNPEPSIVYWGDAMTSFYNEAFGLIVGQKHPSILGYGPKQSFPEGWTSEVAEMFLNPRRTGKATRVEHIQSFIQKSDLVEEIYISFTISPIIGRTGAILGIYQTITDVTAFNVAQRRITALLTLSHETMTCATLKDYWQRSLDALDSLKEDIPFALLYSSDVPIYDAEQNGHHIAPGQDETIYKLEQAIGIPKAALESSPSTESDEGIGSLLRKAFDAGDVTLLRTCDGTLPADQFHHIEEARGFGDRVQAVVIYCLRASNTDKTRGFLIIGLNPRLPYNEDYQTFVKLLGTQFTTTMASVVLHEEKQARAAYEGERAARERTRLEDEIFRRREETRAAELKLERLSELAPVGMFMARADSSLIWRNKAWADMMPTPDWSSWVPAIWPADLEISTAQWKMLVVDKKPINFEFRSNRPWKGAHGREDSATDYTWILCSSYPEFGPDGTMLYCTGVLTEISEQKWIQGDSLRRAKEANDAKTQQEAFLDMTAHEIRNPLSVIIQCADAIKESLRLLRKEGSFNAVLDDCVANTDTISYCGQHQKRVVDDILTLSKLDSDLLLFTPVVAQPLNVVRQALNIFEHQAQSADIKLTFTPAPSIAELNIDWVWLDPSRVLQVLMNILTNAIKFTKDEIERVITITLDATHDLSTFKNRDIKFFPSGHAASAPAGAGADIYLLLTVRDTGRGISVDEQQRLFKRFSQASLRTHVQYGGSGLGLWISRQLTEKQGGEIGIVPTVRKGSTFAFYIKAQLAQAPEVIVVPSPSQKGPSLPRLQSSKVFGLHEVQPPLEIDLSQLEVLLVEDNLINQRVLQKQLRKIFKIVHVANHGLEALNVLQHSRYWTEGGDNSNAHKIAVILLDVEMPVMGGVECVKNVRKYEASGRLRVHIPVIGTTANARVEQIQEYKDAGMDDVLPKPFRIPELVAMVEQVLKRLDKTHDSA